MRHYIQEVRKSARRRLRLPVAFRTTKAGREQGAFYLGTIRDASADGIRVTTNRPCKLQTGDKIILHVIHHLDSHGSSLTIEIRAELVWQDQAHQTLGMKMTPGENRTLPAPGSRS